MSKHFSFAPESSFASPTLPTKGLPIRASDGMKTNLDLKGQEIFDGSLAAYSDYYPGLAVHEGEIETDLDSKTAGYFFKSLCGTLTTTPVSGESNIFKHQFLPTGNLSSFTIEQYNSNFPVRYNGVLVNTLKIAAAEGETVIATYGLLAQSAQTEIDQPATVAYDLGHSFNHTDIAAGISIDGNALPLTSSVEIEFISNKLPQYGLGNANPQSFAAGRYEVKGKFALYLNDSQQISFYQQYLSKAAKSISLTFNGQDLAGVNQSQETLTISLPKAYFSALLNPINAEAARLEVEFVATLDPVTQKLFDLTLINNQVSYES